MKKYSIYLLLVSILLLLSMSGIRSGVKGAMINFFKPFLNVSYDLGSKIENDFSFISNISHLKDENTQLANELQNLEVDKSRINELETENKTLKQELGFLDQTGGNELIPAKIIEREPDTFLDYIVVDKGKNDGVTTGMAVVTENVLVGMVSEVYDGSAKITLVTSNDSIVQAMLQDSRDKGLLRGGISGLYLDNLMSDVVYKPGEFIVTSGLGGKIKEGILIGKASGIESSSGIFKKVSVEPAADLSKLELIFIEK